MVVEVVLGLEQPFRLGSAEVKLHPLLVDRLRDAVCLNASISQPGLDSINALLSWREQIVDLLGRVELSIRLGVWVGAA
jgi:hypothetical protein